MENNINVSVVSCEKLNTISCSQGNKSYELDFDKVKTVEECVLLMRAMITGFNSGYEANVRVYDNSPFYDKLKHLAKE